MPVVKSFNCPSCGAPIKDIKNPKVTCEYCGSTYCIEGLDSCLNVIDCQVKCNTIREKIFEAPRRESGN